MSDPSCIAVPIRLALTLVGFPVFVLLTLPFYGIANSTSVHDRVEVCLLGLLLFAPAFVLLVALGYSAFSMAGIPDKGRLLSLLIVVTYLLYGGLLFPMMLRGPIRGF
ncbi:MAG: hypothetical protein AAF802_30455 [Planctomycetota bacterium]